MIVRPPFGVQITLVEAGYLFQFGNVLDCEDPSGEVDQIVSPQSLENTVARSK